MLSRVVGFSLRNRFVVLTLTVVLLGFGIYTAANSPMDVFPEFAAPRVEIQTTCLGLSAAEVEALLFRFGQRASQAA